MNTTLVVKYQLQGLLTKYQNTSTFSKKTITSSMFEIWSNCSFKTKSESTQLRHVHVIFESLILRYGNWLNLDTKRFGTEPAKSLKRLYVTWSSYFVGSNYSRVLFRCSVLSVRYFNYRVGWWRFSVHNFILLSRIYLDYSKILLWINIGLFHKLCPFLWVYFKL